MTEEEKNNFETQKKLAMQDAKFSVFVEEMREFKNDVKAAQEKYDANMKAAQEKHDADMKEIRGEIHGILKHIQNLVLASMSLTIAAVVGILAIAIGVLGFLWTTANNMHSSSQPVQTQSTYQMPPEQPR